MRVKCSNCEKELDSSDAMQVFAGRKLWLCWECYKDGQREAAACIMYRGGKIRKNETK